MIRYNPLLCLDFYKTAHAEQYPQTLTKMVSYYTPRMTRLGDTDKVTMFGLQAFIKEYLIDAFNVTFSNKIGTVSLESINEFSMLLLARMGSENRDLRRFMNWVPSFADSRCSRGRAYQHQSATD